MFKIYFSILTVENNDEAVSCTHTVYTVTQSVDTVTVDTVSRHCQ